MSGPTLIFLIYKIQIVKSNMPILETFCAGKFICITLMFCMQNNIEYRASDTCYLVNWEPSLAFIGPGALIICDVKEKAGF